VPSASRPKRKLIREIIRLKEELKHADCRQPVGQRGGLLVCARLPQAAQQVGHGERVVEGGVDGRITGQQG
jgi:hypothetical protein